MIPPVLAVALLPVVIGLLTDPELTADLCDRRAAVRLLQREGDLLLGKPGLLHPENSSFLERSNYAIFLVLSGPVFREKTTVTQHLRAETVAWIVGL